MSAGCTTPSAPRSPALPAAVRTCVLWKRPFGVLEWYRRQKGPTFTLQALDEPPYVVMSRAEDIRAILTAPSDVLHAGEGAAPVAPITGESSFMVLDEHEHLAGRRAVLPALHDASAREHERVVGEVARSTVASWPRDTRIALAPHLRAMALEVILRSALGGSTIACDGGLATLHTRVLAMLSVTSSSVYRAPRLRHGPGKWIWQRFLRARDGVDNLLYACIDERREERSDATDMLAALLAARRPDGSSMSREQVRDSLMSLIVAGHETTASQLAWAFQLLARNPAVQARLMEEIDGGLDDRYLTATVQEAIRHRPTFVFAIPRAVKQPIEIGGWTYHPPAHLLACFYLHHHDPRAYPEPQAFKPTRFLEPQPGSSTWLAWGGGHRRCPGRHLAMEEMKTVLRATLSCMTIEPGSRRMERPRWRSMIVTPHAGSVVVLRPRRRPPGARPRRAISPGKHRTRRT